MLSNIENKKEYCKNQAISRLGETRLNTLGSKMYIVNYTNSSNIIVQFDDGYTVKTTYQHFVSGRIKNPWDKSVYGIGYVGIGKYQTHVKSVPTPEYIAWKDMIRRCVDQKLQIKFPTYKNCTVCDEWLNFQNFADWYVNNYYQVDDERMAIDKDILNKGNKVYSPENCIFVPASINSLFIKRNASRGDYPLGVSYHPSGKYISRSNMGKSKLHYLGMYNTPEEAFLAYKEFKESYIKQVADEYKGKIPERLWNAMYNYKVEIDD